MDRILVGGAQDGVVPSKTMYQEALEPEDYETRSEPAPSEEDMCFRFGFISSLYHPEKLHKNDNNDNDDSIHNNNVIYLCF